MEPIFQNRHFITQSNMTEYYKKVAPLWVNLLFYPAIILVAGGLMYLAFRELYTLVFSIVLSIFIIIIDYERVKDTYSIYYKRYLVNKLENLERVVDFSDCITVYSPSTGAKNIFEYNQVIKIVETKNLYILILPYRLNIYLEKGRFTIGNEMDFKTFIKSKCDNLR